MGTDFGVAHNGDRARVHARRVIGGTVTEGDFEAAVGAAAQDAVWKTQHPLTHHLAEDDPRRAEYLREYQMSVGRQVLKAIENLRRGSASHEVPRDCGPDVSPNTDFYPGGACAARLPSAPR